MARKLKLPDIGEGVVEGEIIKWLVNEGQSIAEDQSLVEVMTDKVNVEIPSPTAGTVLKILAKEGNVIKVGEPIVVIGEPGEKIEEAEAPSTPAATPPPSSPEPAIARPEVVLAAPAVRRVAKEVGIDITVVKGTAPGGRITEDDVRAFAKLRAVPVAEVGSERVERVPLRGIRRTIAERMIQSKRSAAHVTHVDEVDMTALIAVREKMKESGERSGIKLTYLPFVIKAVIEGLKEQPYLNASIDEERGEIVVKKYYNIGIATSTSSGLMVPVVKDCDRKSVLEIARVVQELAEKARQGRLELHEVHDGTFTLTNIGPIGGVLSTPIINYPEAAILGLNKISKRPVVRDNLVVVRDMMYLSLSFDHRLVDGAEAAEFLNKVIRRIENPELLHLEEE